MPSMQDAQAGTLEKLHHSRGMHRPVHSDRPLQMVGGMINSESSFQEWVVDLFTNSTPPAHVQVHNELRARYVPDLSVAWNGYHMWLELKHGRFKLGRKRYDTFAFQSLTLGQLYWLMRRQQEGPAVNYICGVLAHFVVGDTNMEYLFFMTGCKFYEECWSGRKNVGSVILGRHSRAMHHVRTAQDLVDFIKSAV